MAILPDNTLYRKIYDTYTSTGDASWARFSWSHQIDLSGVAFDNSKTCTLISPLHVLMAAHFSRDAQDTVVFHRPDGSRVERTILEVRKTEGIIVNGIASGRDIAVGLLDAPIADINFFRVLQPRTNWVSDLANSLVVASTWNGNGLSGQREARIMRISNFSTAGLYFRHIRISPDHIGTPHFPVEVPTFYAGTYPFSGGDSGNPSFALIGGEPILIHFLSTEMGTGPFIWDPEIFDTINTLMAALGGGYQLTTVPLDP